MHKYCFSLKKVVSYKLKTCKYCICLIHVWNMMYTELDDNP